jgi:5,6,7,8-tetrahydromethanopterin hydro-lyase
LVDSQARRSRRTIDLRQHVDGETMNATDSRQLYIGEALEGHRINLAHINVPVGPSTGAAGQALATALATPSIGHAPFVIVARPGAPTEPLTLYVNKAQIANEFPGNATRGALQAGVAKAVAESLEEGVLPTEAKDNWAIVSANWVNPACDDLAVYEKNYRACKNAIRAAMLGLPERKAVDTPCDLINDYSADYRLVRGLFASHQEKAP